MDHALARRGLRILVAEDEPLAAMVIEDALTECGHTVVLAADGEEALRLAEAGSFDLLVTDLAMPRMTGWELIPRLRAAQPDLPVVVMTGFLPANGHSLLESREDSPMALLLKPFQLGDLVKAIGDVVARSGAQSGAQSGARSAAQLSPRPGPEPLLQVA
ncbi:MAG: response regulator [Belnapia sp.]|nr:response regulator [Belnapia sp.]